MAVRDVRLRSLAAIDITHAIDSYHGEGDDELALRFIDALERAIGHIQRSPQAGSLQFSYELGVPELRARKLARFPFVIFYVPGDEYIDVWRILHSRRDVPGAFRDDE